MAGADHSSLLRRKMGAPALLPRAVRGVPPEIGVMRAAARAAYSAAGLKVEMLETSLHEMAGLAELTKTVADAMMVVPFRAPDDVEGFVALSQDFAQSLIEKATTGRLSQVPVDARVASSIDLLLCRDFFLRFLEIWREISEGSPTHDWLEGYAPEQRTVDIDLMALNARDTAYRGFRIKLRFDGQRDADMLAIFPVERHPVREVEAAAPVGEQSDWGAVWRDAVLDSSAALDAVLMRKTLPIKTVRGWKVGDVVALPASSLGTVMLGRRGGAVVATARLGQARGYRALRLNTLTKSVGGAALPSEETAPPPPEPPAPDFDEMPTPVSDGATTGGKSLEKPETPPAAQLPASPNQPD